MILDDRLNRGDLIVLDGATGSEIPNFGGVVDPVAWCGVSNIKSPDAVRSVHEAYIREGADIITTNTFATCRHVLNGAGHGDRTVEINRRAAELAHEARTNAADGREIAVAGSLANMAAWIPGTIKSDPRYLPADNEAYAANFREQAQTLADSGVDFLILEMMTGRDVDMILAEAAWETGLPVWVGLSASLGPDGDVVPWDPKIEHPTQSDGRDGQIESFETSIERFAVLEPQVMGVMHSTLAATAPALAILKDHWSGPIMTYPETIGTEAGGNRSGVSCAPDHFADACSQLVDDRVHVVGGCCGTTVAHLAALAEKLGRRPH
ncbi:MAG: hypothetical protein CMM46_03770 [Rhodospirillaceae bacterium]|nr:hypothetical protein [Rhodospirillaceae bacterium]|tara:strand:- start:10853 stop:11821 length:969 start_codon:yes stop_codon:yes gene_type:complete